MQTIKLLSLNVALFEKNNDKLKRFIKEQNADIICLQEVTRKMDRSTIDDYISIQTIEDIATHLPFSFFVPNVIIDRFERENFHGKPFFSMHFNGFLELGNYIRSKFPILKGQGVFLQSHFTYSNSWGLDSQEEDSRAAQVADLDISQGKKLRIINYHGIWSRDKIDTKQTKDACQKIYNLAAEVLYPSIICGDFNLFPHTDSMKLFNDKFISLVDRHKIKTTRPISNELHRHERNVVDYIFVSPEVKIVDFQVVDSDVSDHLPLVLQFTIQ